MNPALQKQQVDKIVLELSVLAASESIKSSDRIQKTKMYNSAPSIRKGTRLRTQALKVFNKYFYESQLGQKVWVHSGQNRVK